MGLKGLWFKVGLGLGAWLVQLVAWGVKLSKPPTALVIQAKLALWVCGFGAHPPTAASVGAGIGDVSNAKLLFERVLSTEVGQKQKQVWLRYARFEYETGLLQDA